MSKNTSRVPAYRLLTQLAFLALVTTAAIRHQLLGGGPDGSASIDALCPFGGLETLYKFVASGGFINRLYYSDLVLLAGTIALALIVGRYFCGWICALGTLQELSRKLGQRLFRKRHFVMPAVADKPLRWLKYLVLLGTLYLTWQTATLIIRPYDPWAAYAHAFAGLGEMWAEFAVGASILLLSLIASVFYDRVFCKYVCPLGAFLGLTTKLGAFRIRRETDACISCGLCEQKCPVNIPLMRRDVIHSAECIACLGCTTTCPTGKRGTEHEGKSFLHNTLGRFKVSPGWLATLGLALFLGTLGAAKLAGVWQTSPATLTEVVSTDGALDPANIRGFMTLSEVATTFHVDLDTLYRELGFTQDKVPPDTPCKAIRQKLGVSETEFDTQRVRDAVARLRQPE
ncbi:4Fe-4S binding protein [Viridibacterium curvum]|uniref:4Fe-4S binding protein n=1 Tax=Viridibacterium curvum TaxID=1101404 RepID=A0ABP9R602_9RHOO